MLDFHPLTAANFPRFEEDILRSEAIFPENIRESGEDYLAALKRRRAMGLIARHGQAYVGNVVGFSPCRKQREELRLNEHPAPNPVGLIYLFNIVTMRTFRAGGAAGICWRSSAGRPADAISVRWGDISAATAR